MNEEEVEIVARAMAAEKMGLTKDKYGKRLPEELWKQCVSKARESFDTCMWGSKIGEGGWTCSQGCCSMAQYYYITPQELDNNPK